MKDIGKLVEEKYPIIQIPGEGNFGRKDLSINGFVPVYGLLVYDTPTPAEIYREARKRLKNKSYLGTPSMEDIVSESGFEEEQVIGVLEEIIAMKRAPILRKGVSRSLAYERFPDEKTVILEITGGAVNEEYLELIQREEPERVRYIGDFVSIEQKRYSNPKVRFLWQGKIPLNFSSGICVAAYEDMLFSLDHFIGTKREWGEMTNDVEDFSSWACNNINNILPEIPNGSEAVFEDIVTTAIEDAFTIKVAEDRDRHSYPTNNTEKLSLIELIPPTETRH